VSTNRFVATIRESNRQGRDAWERFATHRERVTAVLSGFASKSSSLCILGAGNLNDLELGDLLDLFRSVHLVDVDVDAVRVAVARRGFGGRKTCMVHGPIDLSGILHQLPAAATSDGTRIAQGLLATLERQRCSLPGGPFEVTVSTGVLTQLLQSVVDSALAPDDMSRVSLTLRDKHLCDLMHLTQPGGTMILISDVVSTSTAPQLLEAADSELEEHLAALVAARNFFTGTNPYRIRGLLEQDPRFGSKFTDVRLLDPWLWAVTGDRQHLTYAIIARSRDDRQSVYARVREDARRSPPDEGAEAI
jgi:hypothetical protein